MSSQRERLLGRKRPSVDYKLPVDDPAQARRELERARKALADAEHADRPIEELDAARRAVEAAEQAVDACYEQITLRAMLPEAFEELVAAHPPREGTDDETWNTETFPRACFLACVESDMSESDWAAFLRANLNRTERVALFNTAIAVNIRLINPAVPKD